MFKDADDPIGHFRDISTFGGCIAGPAAALENMRILEDEKLVENAAEVGAHLIGRLEELMDEAPLDRRRPRQGPLRGGRAGGRPRRPRSRSPRRRCRASSPTAWRTACIIGSTNRSVPGRNNTLLFAPALISTRDDMDRVVEAVDAAIGRVLG